MSDDAVVSYALSLEGLSWSATPDRYAAECCPYDTDRDARAAAAREEFCGLVCEAILRRCEVDGTVRHHGQMLDALTTPFAQRVKSGPVVVSYLETLGRQRGRWREPRPGQRPKPGDMVVILGPTHALTVTGWDGDRLESIDGGQIDEGNSGKCTAIKRCVRPWHDNGAPYVVDTQGRHRAVYGWLEAGDLPCRP